VLYQAEPLPDCVTRGFPQVYAVPHSPGNCWLFSVVAQFENDSKMNHCLVFRWVMRTKFFFAVPLYLIQLAKGEDSLVAILALPHVFSFRHFQ
jgi:hypothetical protein